LRFRISEMISSIEVKNGQRVAKGQILAKLESFEQENARDQAIQALEKSEIDMKDALISYGYNDKDSVNIPQNILKVAQTRSGYLTAKSDLKKAVYALTHTQLKAPFTGLIANLETHAFNQAETGKAFCLLIDDRKLEVSFSVLESDLAEINLGQKIELTPFGKSSVFNGQISEINPLVDEHAMVKVKALVQNHNRSLISGMNAKVKIIQSIPNQIFIPKSALVLRQGKPVVFTWEKGHAHWNYVELGQENSTQINVQSGLKEDQILIISGNLNLAHKSPVSIQP
ncbi:MAG: efflux RND transporter periplasmic adaptor subunit, partial [Bacteroidota bacterium]